MSIPVPVFRPQLPDASRLLPYLRRIDESRTYTNWGPLAGELEHRLADHFGLVGTSVVSAGSGTAALVGAILATAGRATPERPLALVPAYTFVATAIAAEHCGYRPYLVDVDPDTWSIDLERLMAHPALDDVGLVLPVAPFGRAVPQAPCRAFRVRTNIPVVIDGGASFEALSDAPGRGIGDVPLALSFHATKSFSTGEGGAVVSTDTNLSRRVVRALNFGFHGDRNSRSASTNGKMSEFHAAVGLAELDGWHAKRTSLASISADYRASLDSKALPGRFHGSPDVASCYALLDIDSAIESSALRERLRQDGIEFRYWYGDGLHRHQYFEGISHDALDVTERLASALIGVPTAPDLDVTIIERIANALANGPIRR